MIYQVNRKNVHNKTFLWLILFLYFFIVGIQNSLDFLKVLKATSDFMAILEDVKNTELFNLKTALDTLKTLQIFQNTANS